MAGLSQRRHRRCQRLFDKDVTIRHQRRDRSPQSFWRSLGVLGMVGWPIALATVGGAWLGRLLDRHWHTGVRFTLMLLTLGVMMGSYTAWRTLKERS